MGGHCARILQVLGRLPQIVGWSQTISRTWKLVASFPGEGMPCSNSQLGEVWVLSMLSETIYSWKFDQLKIYMETQFFTSWLSLSTLSLKTVVLGRVWSFLYLTSKTAHQSKFDKKWINLMKYWKPMSQKFIWGHAPWSSTQGRRRVTLIFGGEKIKISKLVFHHRFSWSIYFQIYLQIWNWLGRN